MTETPVALGSSKLFPELEADAYLAFAAIAPVSVRVSAAVNAVLNDYARHGQPAFLSWVDQRQRLREKLASLLNTRADEIALTSGTTRGIVDVALCLPWKSGDTVLLYQGEFPANVSPWQNVAKLFGLKIRFLPKPDPHADDSALLEPLHEALSQGARLLACSAVQFQTGYRMPLGEIGKLCREYGTELAVDGIQACGVLPLDLSALNIDYFVGGAHKWLMGVEGAGFVHVRAERASCLVPRTAGWLSHEAGTLFLFAGEGELRYDRPIRSGIQYMEGSSSSALGFAALEAGLDPLQELSPSAIFSHVSAYLDELEAGLLQRGHRSLRAKNPERRSGILSIAIPAGVSPTDLLAGLRSRRVIATTPDGVLRFAPHFPNARSEIPIVLAALDATLRELAR